MIVIHIGSRKAGSTSLQEFLAENEVALREHAIDYPRPGRGKGLASHRNIACDIAGLKQFVAHRGDLKALAEHWQKKTAAVMIVSAEGFQNFSTDQARRLRQLMRNEKEEVRILMVVRDLLEVMPSSYAQMVKMGRKTHSFDEFFEKKLKDATIKYDRVARSWAKEYGWESMRVSLLNREHLLNGDLIDEFLSQAGLDPDAPWVRALVRLPPTNVTPGWRVVEAIRALYSDRAELDYGHPFAEAQSHSNNQREVIGRLALDLGAKLGWNKDKGRYLTGDQAEACLAIYTKSVRKLNEKLDIRLPEPLGLAERGFKPRDDLPDVSRIPRTDLLGFYDYLAEAFGKIDGQNRPRAGNRTVGSPRK